MLTLNKKPASAPEAEAPVEAQAEAQVQAPVEGEAAVVDSTIGTLSDKIAFVAPLGNPLRDDVTTVEVDGKKEKKITPFIVGYRMKALVDLVVPDCGTTDRFKKDYMDYNDINGKKEVKAGETFDVTPFEMAVLASDKRINRTFSGGERVAICCWSKKELTGGGKAGDVTVKSMPRAVLRLTEGSIKDYAMVNVCEKTIEMDENGNQKKVGKINAGFEKWAPLCKATVRTAGARAAGSKSGKAVYDASAAGFMAILKSKGFQEA